MTETQDTTSAGAGTLPRILSACAAVGSGTSTGVGSGPAKLAGPENAAIRLLMRGAGAADPATPTGLTTGYSSSGGNACSRMSAVDGFTISFLRM